MTGPRLVADFETAEQYLAAHDAEVSAGGLLVRGAVLPPGAPSSSCTLLVRIAGADVAVVPATIASVAPGTGVAVIFLVEPVALLELAKRLRAADASDDGASAEDGSAAGSSAPDTSTEVMSLPDRIKLAQTGGREVRLKLLRDPNKQLHAFVLKNRGISLEEVLYAARQASLSPDALKLIAEHAEWSHNVGVATALVKNPRTPIPLALKLLPRISTPELRSIAKGNGRAPIVQAARKMLTG